MTVVLVVAVSAIGAAALQGAFGPLSAHASRPATLSSVTISPTTATLAYRSNQTFIALPSSSAGSNAPTGVVFAWSLDPLSAGTLNTTSGSSVSFSAGNTTLNATLSVNATQGSSIRSSTADIVIERSTGLSISSFSAAPLVIPMGGSTVLHVLVTGAQGVVSYAYSDLPAGCVSSNTSALSCAPDSAGSYFPGVTVTDLSGTSANATATLDVNAPLPTSCVQGPDTVDLPPQNGDMQPALVAAYDQVGQAGGGTIDLGPGTYYFYETIVLQQYSNVTIEGAGMGKTILSLPPDPVGVFKNQTGTPVGLRGTTKANFIQIQGPAPIDRFEMCDLTIDARAVNTSEEWWGSLIFDESGGFRHVYRNVEERNLFGPSPNPNGLHLVRSPWGPPAVGYIIDDLVATNDTVSYDDLGYAREGGADFLGVAGQIGCRIENLSAMGYVEFGLAPSQGCILSNWYVHGHLLVDPPVGGPWSGTIFENDTFDIRGSGATDAASLVVYGWPGGQGGSNFTGLEFVNDTFYGRVLHAANMDDVQGCAFYGGLDTIPSIFEGSTVEMTASDIFPPILLGGAPYPITNVTVADDTFVFTNGTGNNDPFQIGVPTVFWTGSTIEISGRTTGFLFEAPGIALSVTSSISNLRYESMGNDSPAQIDLFDPVLSPGFLDLGATVADLVGIADNLVPV
ncbi:MAG: hypothetical protein WA761_06440 [Thermoplasmata archaeon]